MTKKEKSIEKMPILFFGHGSPMNAIENNEFTKSLERLEKTLPPPKAILMISAHWETKGTWVTGMSTPKTIHDFYGFPKELFNIQYPAPGDPKLAENLSSQMTDPKVQVDINSWGLDHGTWAILKRVFPKAHIPAIQLSLDRSKSLRDHFQLGQKLNFLREEGVMIMGSGNIVHNLREINWTTNAKPHDWAIEFDEWAKDKLIHKNFDALISEVHNTTAGKLSVPTLEHYLPLLYILGASDPTDSLDFTYQGFQNASMSMRSVRFS